MGAVFHDHRISGFVRLLDGRGVSGAMVTVVAREGGERRAAPRDLSNTHDVDRVGEFELVLAEEVVADGVLELEVSRAGFETTRHFVALSTDLATATEGVELIAVPILHEVYGRVVDPDGLPVLGARVQSRSARGGRIDVATTSDSGEFDLPGVAAADIDLIQAMHADWHDTWVASVDVGARLSGVRIAFVGVATVRGRVVDVNGRPVVGARVQAEATLMAHQRRWFEPFARTDASGRFDLVGMPARPLTIHVHVPKGEGRYASALAQPITLERGERRELELQLAE